MDQAKGAKRKSEVAKEKVEERIHAGKINLRNHEKAREIIREAGLKTQELLSYHISEITSLALESVFDDPYSLQVEFVHKRNKTECDLYFVRDGFRVDPMTESGGGAVDIASFALRIASWSMMNPKLRNTIILDEPLKNLSKDLQEKGSLMIKEVSKKLGIQFIIITHEEMLTMYADRIFEVKKVKKGKKKFSKVSIIDQTDETEYSRITSPTFDPNDDGDR